MTARAARAPQVVWLADCRAGDRDRIGGKAVGLGLLMARQMSVPDGFVISADAYREQIAAAGLPARIERLIAAATPGGLADASRQIERLFMDTRLSQTLTQEVCGAYAQLGSDLPVAVRSSADVEDTIDASFAGQHESFLCVRGQENLLWHIRRCWASLFTPHAITYRADRGLSGDAIAMAVVVQKMVPASVSGVMMTLDPVIGDLSQITIEASYGLGLAAVGGEVTPDRYAVDKVTLSVRDRSANRKHLAYVWDERADEVRATTVPEADRDKLCLADAEVVTIAALGKHLERALGAPQDVEWALGPGEPESRELFLLQTRPETAWRKRSEPVTALRSSVMDRMLAAMLTRVRPKN